MKSLTCIIILVIASVALAGCTQTPPPAQGGTATSISITRAPTDAAANSNANVCWSVQGSGTVPHVAIHTDTASHNGSSTTFNDYAGPAYYANNEGSAQPKALPGEFCANVTIGTQTVYFRGHVIDGSGGNGRVTEERSIQVRSSAAVIGAVRITEAPATAQPNSAIRVCWEVTGTGSIPHTAIHTDTVSHPAATSFQEYKGNASYPNNRTSQDAAGYTLPGNFCTSNVMTPSNGTLYLRGHAMTNSPPGILSATERTVAINGTNTTTSLATALLWEGAIPANARAGSQVLACWQVRGTGMSPHTAIHTDTATHALEPQATFQTYAGPAYYPDNMTAANATGYRLPGTFCTNVVMPAAGMTLYMRLHALDSTPGTGRLSVDERSITSTI